MLRNEAQGDFPFLGIGLIHGIHQNIGVKENRSHEFNVRTKIPDQSSLRRNDPLHFEVD
jgi:hypothetical protein